MEVCEKTKSTFKVMNGNVQPLAIYSTNPSSQPFSSATNMPHSKQQGLINPGNEIDFEETWNIISNALGEMHTKNASKLSFEAIYRQAYKVVLKKKGEMFYDRIQDFEKDWLSNQVRQRLQTLLAPSLYHGSQLSRSASTPNERRAAGERFLRGLKQAFEDHQLVMNMATDVFMYLVRLA